MNFVRILSGLQAIQISNKQNSTLGDSTLGDSMLGYSALEDAPLIVTAFMGNATNRDRDL